MPTAAPKPCSYAGCRALTTEGAYCVTHKKVKSKQAESIRGSSTERGYGYKWQQASKGFLKKHTICECPACLENMRLKKLGLPFSPILPATVVDHKIPPRLKQAKDSGSQALIDKALQLFWDRDNWQPLNNVCHNKKTAKEDGGFTGAPALTGGGQKSTPFYL